MNRPFVTPDALRKHSSYDSVKARSDEQLSADIARAELYAMNYCRQDFLDVGIDTVQAEQLILAIKLLAEMYAFNAQLKATVANESGGGHSLRSESGVDYAYTLSDSTEDLIDIEALGIERLLEGLCVGTLGDIEMLFTAL